MPPFHSADVMILKNTCSVCFSIKIGTGAVVCVEAELRGDITIGKLLLLFFYY